MHCCELWANSREVSPEAALEGGGHAFLHVHQWGKQAIDPSLNDKSNYCTLQGRPSLTTADSLTVPPPQREPVPSFSTRAQVNLLIRFCPTIKLHRSTDIQQSRACHVEATDEYPLSLRGQVAKARTHTVEILEPGWSINIPRPISPARGN
jgi:hypothetical protein